MSIFFAPPCEIDVVGSKISHEAAIVALAALGAMLKAWLTRSQVLQDTDDRVFVDTKLDKNRREKAYVESYKGLRHTARAG